MGTNVKNETPLLEVEDLKVYFPIKSGFFESTIDEVKAVDSVSFTIEQGKTVGLVGESGSGKSTIGKAIVHLAQTTAGIIRYQGQQISGLSAEDFFPYRKKIQMIFQDPYGSLNPRMTVYGIVSEPLNIHFPSWTKKKKRRRASELLEQVGLQSSHLDRYPHEFSGGQRQRIGIARALAVEPEFIVCDEPVSALDVSVQAQIVNLLQDLQETFQFTYLFIGHDLAVVKHISDYVLVMHKGKIVEQGNPELIYRAPQNDYTKKLLAAVPNA